jgi:hypothetical protein
MPIFGYDDLDEIDVGALHNPVVLSKSDKTYKLLRHTGIKAIETWATDRGLMPEITLALRIIKIGVEAEYKRLLTEGSLIDKSRAEARLDEDMRVESLEQARSEAWFAKERW